jgi:uncharacterized OB-fold protein
VTPPPAPTVDRESAAWWAGLREHRVLVQQCAACGRRRLPAMPTCPWCAAPDASIEELPARGHVYSWVVVHRALTDAQATELPYTIAVVELAPGCRVLAHLARPERGAPVTAGMAVEGVWLDHSEWTELRFRPVAS